jgi:transcriptional regulator with XRE-family HTH domain
MTSARAKEVGQKIRARRRKLGLTQVEAAKRAGCGQAWWAEIETGTAGSLGIDTLDKVARALETTAAKLI